MSQHPILDYFSPIRQNIFKCKLCSKEYNSEHTIDALKKHFSRKHYQIWDQIKSPARQSFTTEQQSFELDGLSTSELHILQKALQKKLKTKQPKVKIFAGAIGSGKTTLVKLYEKYLVNKGYVVHRIQEVSLQIPEELEIFYKTKNSLFFQCHIIEKYRKMIKEINHMTDCDYILFDRGPKDIEIFTNVNTTDDKIIEYLNKRQSKITPIVFNDCEEIYVRPEKQVSIERKKLRNRMGETCDDKYLFAVYDEYEKIVKVFYPNHVVFNNNNSLCKNCRELNTELCEDGDCCIKEYYSFFEQHI
ncbi:9204_t:CDS:2 [Gigaspora margarita]|uniref:9204_t:CDS:1 n=1 Tax=Gigaspora margarita TaxID=4874 RepID=A0ABN7VMW0_GIGMA|nr:9204_t:CDS:2 [Gigaspora margarita]